MNIQEIISKRISKIEKNKQLEYILDKPKSLYKKLPNKIKKIRACINKKANVPLKTKYLKENINNIDIETI